MRRFIQFRMSTLLLLVNLCAVALAWCQDHADLRRTLHEADGKLRDANLLRDAIIEGQEVVTEELSKTNATSGAVYVRHQNRAEGASLPGLLDLLSDPTPDVRIDAIDEL